MSSNVSSPTEDRHGAVPMDTHDEAVHSNPKKARRKPSEYNKFIQKLLHREHGDPDILQLPNGERMKAAAKKWQWSKNVKSA